MRWVCGERSGQFLAMDGVAVEVVNADVDAPARDADVVEPEGHSHFLL